jgi:uncharacterized protein (TIGR02588 family)
MRNGMDDITRRTPALEWIAAGVGLALLLAVFAVIGREALMSEPTQPPAITVEARRIVPAGSGYVVEFEAINGSPGTAAAVEIEGKLGDETSTATLDYVAGEGSATGGLFFTRDPRGALLQLRATGYQKP